MHAVSAASNTGEVASGQKSPAQICCLSKFLTSLRPELAFVKFPQYLSKVRRSTQLCALCEPWTAACSSHADGGRLYPDKMFVHRKYFCGESAQRTDAQAKTQRKGRAPCE